MRCRILLPLTLFAIPVLATTVFKEPSEFGKAISAWQIEAVRTLSNRGDADSLFASALIPDTRIKVDFGTRTKQRLALLDQAAALDPAAADIAAAALMECMRVAAWCNVASHVRRLRYAAPDDAGFLWPALKQAQLDDDDEAVTAVLTRMAGFESLDDHWLARATRFARALRHIEPPSLAEAPPGTTPELFMQTQAYAYASASWPLSYLSLTDACKPDQPAFAARREACAAMGRMLQHGSSLVSNLIGLRLTELAAVDAAERESVKATRLRIRWQMDQYAAISAGEDPVFAKDWTAAVAAAGSELGGLRALLQRAGKPLDPPPDWRSGRLDQTHPESPVTGPPSD